MNKAYTGASLQYGLSLAAHLLGKKTAIPHNNIVNGNLFYKVDNMVDGKSCWLELYNNWSTTDDPGFVDSEQPLKGFVKDAPIYRYIKDFEKIPFQEIGCKLPQRR